MGPVYPARMSTPQTPEEAGRRAGAIVTLALCGMIALGILGGIAARVANGRPGEAAGAYIAALVVLAALWWLLALPAVRKLRAPGDDEPRR